MFYILNKFWDLKMDYYVTSLNQIQMIQRKSKQAGSERCQAQLTWLTYKKLTWVVLGACTACLQTCLPAPNPPDWLLAWLPSNLTTCQAVFLFTGRKRITFYCWHFKNFCQKNKNAKLYFAFDFVIKNVKSYIIRKPA